MSELHRELEKIEIDIRAAVVSGDELLYSKLNREKSELNQKIFFAESRNLREQVESLTESRQAAIAQKSELENALKDSADIVLARRSALFDAEQEYQKIGTFIFYAETQIEQQRKDIRALQQKLDAHVQSKLNSGDSPIMETLTNETTV